MHVQGPESVLFHQMSGKHGMSVAVGPGLIGWVGRRRLSDLRVADLTMTIAAVVLRSMDEIQKGNSDFDGNSGTMKFGLPVATGSHGTSVIA
jgi:hypothetical protein